MNYPEYLMQNILWNFGEKKFFSYYEFVQTLKEYHQSIKGEFVQDIDSPALKIPEVVIQYMYWDEEDEAQEPDFLVKANNGKFFSTGELLFKIHNEVCENLSDADHKFFEGLQLYEGDSPNYPKVPLYFLLQGS